MREQVGRGTVGSESNDQGSVTPRSRSQSESAGRDAEVVPAMGDSAVDVDIDSIGSGSGGGVPRAGGVKAMKAAKIRCAESGAIADQLEGLRGEFSQFRGIMGDMHEEQRA